jgi:hypothetical protein
MRRALLATSCLAVSVFAASAARAQSKGPGIVPTPRSAAGHPTHKFVKGADIAWQDAPPNLPRGAKIAVLEGDPSKIGSYVMRLKIPDGYKIAAHWHPKTENLTVIQGTFYLGTGDKLDPSKGTPLKAGDFSTMPGGMHHYAWSQGETIVQAHGMGPFQMNYVDPTDDPSKPAKK